MSIWFASVGQAGIIVASDDRFVIGRSPVGA